MTWLRRLFAPPARGTITLLDGGVIIGFPPGSHPDPGQARALKTVLAEWLASESRMPLVLPWPVDVTDHRTRPWELR